MLILPLLSVCENSVCATKPVIIFSFGMLLDGSLKSTATKFRRSKLKSRNFMRANRNDKLDFS